MSWHRFLTHGAMLVCLLAIAESAVAQDTASRGLLPQTELGSGIQSGTSSVAATGGVLHNGINLPAQWPPNIRHMNRDPMPVPYLLSLPDVIPIDVGRQMFVDDFLVESTTLKRSFHKARMHPAAPVPTSCNRLEPGARRQSGWISRRPTQSSASRWWSPGGAVSARLFTTPEMAFTGAKAWATWALRGTAPHFSTIRFAKYGCSALRECPIGMKRRRAASTPRSAERVSSVTCTASTASAATGRDRPTGDCPVMAVHQPRPARARNA